MKVRLEPMRLSLSLSTGQGAAVDAIVDQGIVGSNAEEVVHYLITRSLDDLARSRMLPTIIGPRA